MNDDAALSLPSTSDAASRTIDGGSNALPFRDPRPLEHVVARPGGLRDVPFNEHQGRRPSPAPCSGGSRGDGSSGSLGGGGGVCDDYGGGSGSGSEMTMGAGAAVLDAEEGCGLASDSLGWSWKTGTEREVVVGLDDAGIPSLLELLGAGAEGSPSTDVVVVDSDVLNRCCLEMEEALSWVYRRSRAADGSVGALEIRVVRPSTFEGHAEQAVARRASLN